MKNPTFKEIWNALESGQFCAWAEEIQKKGLALTNYCHNTPLHIAAMSGHLNRIPKKFLTREALLTPGHEGYTPLHLAAGNGQLNQLPKKTLLLEGILLEPDSLGNTSVHYAARWGHLAQIPPEVLNEKTLLLRDTWGTTVVESAAMTGLLEHIPIKLPLPLLHQLREWPHTSRPAQKWIEKEIKTRRRDTLQQALHQAKHPSL